MPEHVFYGFFKVAADTIWNGAAFEASEILSEDAVAADSLCNPEVPLQAGLTTNVDGWEQLVGPYSLGR